LRRCRRLKVGGVLAALAVGIITVFVYEIVIDWGHNVKAFKEGYKLFK